MAGPIDADLLFGHRFQKRALGAWRGTVDFIGQQQLREYRAGMKTEVALFLIEDGNTEDVRRQQIRRELQALEGKPQRCGE